VIRLLLWLLLLFGSVLAALWFQQQQGFVLLHVNGVSIQASLVVSLLGSVAMVGAAYVLLRLIVGVVGLPGGARRWLSGRRRERERSRMLAGFQQLAEGEFAGAEKAMVKAAVDSGTPLLNYLGAATAAHRQGAHRRRDRYLASADQSTDGGKLAVGLTQAQLHIDDGQWETAFATLNLLQSNWPRHPRVLELLALVCRQIEEWGRLLEILPLVRRYTALDEPYARGLERDASAGLLRVSARRGRQELDLAWNRLPRNASRDDAVRLAYIDGLLLLDPGDETAEKLLRQGLQRSWKEAWVQRYGRLSMQSPEAVLSRLEHWLTQHPDDPELLLATGRQAIASRRMDRARTLLDDAVRRGVGAEACYLLGRVLQGEGQSEAAAALYRQALEQRDPYAAPAALGTGSPVGLPQQQASIAADQEAAPSLGGRHQETTP
jgi:HemY protein